MATFAQNLVASLTQPSYTQGLLTAAERLGSAPARNQRQAEARMAQEGLFSAMQNAQNAAMAGDVEELQDISTGLQDLLSTVKNPTVRNSIGEGMGQISQLMVAAQPKYITNQARALNGLRAKKSGLESQIEELNAQFDQGEGNFEIAEQITQAENQLSTLDDQIEKLSGNADVLIEANTIKFNTELQSYINEIELTNKANTAFALRLRNLDPNSEAYEQTLRQAEKAGATGAEDLDKQYRLEREKADLEIQQLRDTDGPLSNLEISQAETLGINWKSLSPKVTRNQMISILSSRVEAKNRANLSANLAPGPIAGKAYARLYIEEIARRGATEPGYGIFKIPGWSDIEDKINDMSPEELNGIVDLIPEDATYDQIMNSVQEALSRKFPKQFKKFKEIVPEFDREFMFQSLVRQITLDNPTASKVEIENAARQLIAEVTTALDE